jgi:hypothetical protein
MKRSSDPTPDVVAIILTAVVILIGVITVTGTEGAVRAYEACIGAHAVAECSEVAP